MFDDLCLADQNQTTDSQLKQLEMGFHFKKEEADSPRKHYGTKKSPKYTIAWQMRKRFRGKAPRVLDDELDG